MNQSLIYTVLDNKPEMNLRDGIVSGMKEAISLAENAFDVMEHHSGDEHVQRMVKYVLGDQDFQRKYDAAKREFIAFQIWVQIFRPSCKY